MTLLLRLGQLGSIAPTEEPVISIKTGNVKGRDRSSFHMCGELYRTFISRSLFSISSMFSLARGP